MTTKKPTEVTETHIRELLAYELHRGNSTPVSSSAEVAAEAWRNLTLEGRGKARHCATVIAARLESYGISMRASNSRKVLDTLDALTTIPAKPAYDLTEATQEIKIK